MLKLKFRYFGPRTELKRLSSSSSNAKNCLIGKDPDAGKDPTQEEKGATEDEMLRWHHRFNGHEFEQTPGDSEGLGRPVCCSPWDCKELDGT